MGGKVVEDGRRCEMEGRHHLAHELQVAAMHAATLDRRDERAERGGGRQLRTRERLQREVCERPARLYIDR